MDENFCRILYIKFCRKNSKIEINIVNFLFIFSFSFLKYIFYLSIIFKLKSL